MSDQQPQAPEALTAPPMEQVLASLLHAVDSLARKASGVVDVREVQEYGAATLNFAQSYAILHPDVIAPQGVSPDRIAASTPAQPKAPGGGK